MGDLSKHSFFADTPWAVDATLMATVGGSPGPEPGLWFRCYQGPGPASVRGSEPALCGWLGQAVPGEVLEYHRGRLALDADRVTSKLPMDARQELARVARRALWAFGHGLVHLVQRRLGADDFSYLIIARPRSRKATASLSGLQVGEAA
jgi:hypothetical protein